MGAISKTMGVPEGAVASFKAGADILLICKDQQVVVESIESMRQEILSGEITMSRLHESLERINSARLKYLHTGREISMTGIKEYFNLKV
jgi:beta-N-acetylhexosaminidase